MQDLSANVLAERVEKQGKMFLEIHTKDVQKTCSCPAFLALLKILSASREYLLTGLFYKLRFPPPWHRQEAGSAQCYILFVTYLI